MPKCILLACFVFLSCWAQAQAFRLQGRIANSRNEPLSFVSVRVIEEGRGVVSRNDGSFEIWLDAGKYRLAASMVGFRNLVVPINISKDTIVTLQLEDDSSQQLSGVVVKAKSRDRAEEVMRMLVSKKDSIATASGAYSVSLYIRASQQETKEENQQKNRRNRKVIAAIPDELKGFSLAEVSLLLDCEPPNKIRETRLGVQKSGKEANQFFLSATEGNFDLYENLLKLPGVSPTPFVSPVSGTGLLSYRFKTIKTVRRGKHRIYTISVQPRELTNATLTGELTVSDSSWSILHTRFQLPAYHLQEYSFLEIEQDYGFIAGKAWMLTRQQFRYLTASGRTRIEGKTVATYSNYQLGRNFAKRHFGTEVSTTGQQAYEQNKAFWDSVRIAPLAVKEEKLVRFSDSIRTVQQSDRYLDSVERQINKITWQKIGLFGQSFYTRKKERYWHLPSLISLYQPVAFGGSRINLSFTYRKTFANRKDLFIDNNISYGIRNSDVNGYIKLRRMYNPFSRGYYEITGGRDFQAIFQGDAWINMVSRSNVFLNNYVQMEHGLEIVNGLKVTAEVETAFRRSVVGYKTGNLADSLLGDLLNNNQAVAFDPYNALYGRVRLQYTPFQRYRREPREKVILGSRWPTFYVQWRKGIPGFLRSKVDFDFLEYGAEQHLNLGLVGIGSYTVKSGSFLRRPDLRLIDYQFQRRGDPFLFLNPFRSFQALDSTFPVFKRYVEGHYVHEFNGLLLNKIPLFKKLQLREIAGGGFLFAPERNLRYGELFAGVERAFQSPFNPLDKFKLGIYVVGSAANKFQNPVQFKVGFTTWDKRRNRWF